MMNQIAFIIDDSLVNSDDVLSEHHYLINLPITDFTNVNAPIEHDQKCPISFDELTLKVQNNHDLKTSAIVLGEADALLNELLAKYEKIVIIGISPKLSSSYHNWHILLENYQEFKDRILLLPNVSLGNYYLQFSSQLLNPSNQDFSWEHIKQTLSPLLDFKGILFVQDLGCLARGGRISEFKSLIGQILKVKILINYGDGKLNFYSKQISIKRCLSKLVKYVHDELGVSADEPCHLKLWSTFVDQDKFRVLYQQIQNLFPNIIFDIVKCPKPILVHIGLDAIAISW